MPVQSETELIQEIEHLRAGLAEREREAAAKERQLERYAAELRETFKREHARAQQLRRSYTETVRALSNAVEARDAYTGKHAERVAAYGLEIAYALGLRLTERPDLEYGFLLHDVGKVAIPDSILYKPSALTDEERALMEQHPLIGWQMLRHVTFLEGDGLSVIRSHHERWDGGGYPDELQGKRIPLAARIFAVADTLDAMTSDRPYRLGRPWAEARAEILRESGQHFDPNVVEAFISCEPVLQQVRQTNLAA